MTAYDIIPDIHGDLERLTATLSGLGYEPVGRSWRAPSGRQAAFLGDFIDAGQDNAAVLYVVRSMIADGNAVAIMGNHELNAIHYHSEGLNSRGIPDGFMRAHDARNTRQAETFLYEFPVATTRAAEAIGFFKSLPVFLDLGGLRLGHAGWSESAVEAIRDRRPSGILSDEDLQAVALEDMTDPFAAAVLRMTKGPEIPLPDGRKFIDHKGDPRGNIRMRWWAPEAVTWRDISVSVPDVSELPDGICDVPDIVVDPGDVPVAFGHYKRSGTSISIDAPKAMCLDYPDLVPAYRWDGEDVFDARKIVCLGNDELVLQP
jgi:hypothetical protein